MDKQVFISLDLIDPNPYQPRHAEDKDAIAEVAESIHRNGLLQIPSARQVDGRYQLAFGMTRLAAIKLLNTQYADGYSKMPLIIRDLDDLQMFELGVAENIKRRDLNPVEKADAMRRYMQEFNKTSAEAGEFFNETEEYVRSIVRFNELLPEAKEALAAGKINITTARTMLSMQKVAPREVIVETINRLEKGTDRWGSTEKPEEAIEEVLSGLDDIKELWSGDGKPRGGRHDAWLLDMKKFPNQFLPTLTAVDIAMALNIQDNEEALKLIDEYLQYVEAETAEFPNGENDKDYIASCRAQAQKRLDALAKLDPDYVARIQHLISPPTCTACRFHSVVQGTHYCGMETCFSRKTRAWEYEKLRVASKELKIEIYNAEADGEYRVLEEDYTDNGKKHKALFTKRGKDLRLALAVDIDRKKPQSGYNGVPRGAVVMVVGKTLKTMLESGQKERADKRSKQKAAEALRTLKERKLHEFDFEVSAHAKAIFDSLNLAALEDLFAAPSRYGSSWDFTPHNMPGVKRPSEDDGVPAQEDFYRRIFALNMIKKIGGHYNKTISEYAFTVSEKVKNWGVKLPKSVTKLAAQMGAEIEAAKAELKAELEE